MMAEPLPITAEQIVAQAEAAGMDVLEAVGQQLAQMVRADLPPSPPEALDPDPSYSLGDHVEVRRYGNIVSVSVEGPYAVKLHENLQFKHVRGGRAKFLERNATVLARQIEPMLAGEVARTFSGPQRGRAGFSTRIR
jgi:hypothetical protein